VQKTGSEATLRNENGVELKRNSALVKKYNEQKSASVHWGEIQESTQTETGEGGECSTSLSENTSKVHTSSSQAF